MGERHLYKDVLFGLAIADALGVPVEFKSRATIRLNPVTDMIGYGTYNLPPGTFSDDSSLTFCLAEALTHEFSVDTIAEKFIAWYRKQYWTADGHVFDVGIATREAIHRLENGCPPELAGGIEETDNGNGSLMRIMPLLFYIRDMDIEERFDLVKKVSSITHGHVRSVIACFYYLEFARGILQGIDPLLVYRNLQTTIPDFLNSQSINQTEIRVYDRLLNINIQELSEDQIFSSGYVLHTLEAAIWCLLTTRSYKEAVLKAINLGEDTDTTGAVTGALAGLLYGYQQIPDQWLAVLKRKNDIEDLADRMQRKFH